MSTIKERMKSAGVVILTPCATCARRDLKNTLRCDAYPFGIPTAILSGKTQHREPFPGDHGLTYQPREQP